MTATADFVATEGDHSFTADEETHALYLKHTTGLSVTLDGVPAEEGETVAVYVPFGTHHLTAKIGGNDWSADIPFTEGANTYDFNEMKLIYSAMPGEGVGINGRVHMYFPVDGKALEGTTAVVFEKLHHFSLQKIRRKSSRMKRGTTASVSQPITEQHSWVLIRIWISPKSVLTHTQAIVCTTGSIRKSIAETGSNTKRNTMGEL